MAPSGDRKRAGMRSPGGTAVEWTECGTGLPVLVSSPAAIPDWYWDPLLRALGTRFRAVLVHPRGLGHGGLPGDLRAVTVADHARDLAQVVDELGLEEYCALGHCVGAAPILESLALVKRRPRAVIVVSARLEPGNAIHNLERVVEQIRVDPRFRAQYAQVAAAYAPPAFRSELERKLQPAHELEAHIRAIQSVRLYPYAAAWPPGVGAIFVTSARDADAIRSSTVAYASRLGSACRGVHQLDGGHFTLLENPDLALPLMERALAS
jgi:pimeloyl-ACP methyl ester carboxylesterase